MARHELLNNIQHKNLRVNTRPGAQFGDNVGIVMTFPTEYADVQREYPIFFRKDPNTGEYTSVALLGLSKDENLYLEGDRWDAAYIPGIVARGPFLIGFQEREENGELRREPMIHVDLEHPRISQTDGESVFLEQGGNSRYLDRIGTILKGINDGLAVSKAMFAEFTRLELIEPIKLEIKVDPESVYDLVGLHTISESKLRNLGAEDVYKLHRTGFLQGALLVLTSLGNIGRLVERKQRRKTRHHPLQQVEGIEKFRDALKVHRRHDRAPVRQDDDESLARQTNQRFANRRARHFEPVAQPDLVERRAGRQLHAENLFPQLRVNPGAAGFFHRALILILNKFKH